MLAHKTFFNWSTGKDSALALHKLMQNPSYSVEMLLTTVNSHFDRVSMHGLRRTLLNEQVKSIGLPLLTVELPENPDMSVYDQIMVEKLESLKQDDFTHAAFGDIFLEDLKKYREEQLMNISLEAIFPLWKMDSLELINEFIDLGFKSIVICVDAQKLDRSFCGRLIDKEFIASLPPDVDPCGENGEFHTFCFDGPVFKYPIPFKKGEIIERTYPSPTKRKGEEMKFYYCDLEVI